MIQLNTTSCTTALAWVTGAGHILFKGGAWRGTLEGGKGLPLVVLKIFSVALKDIGVSNLVPRVVSYPSMERERWIGERT